MVTASPPSCSRDHVLPADLSLAAAPGLKDMIGVLLAEGRPCRLDAGAVASVSTAALQILLAAVRAHAAGAPRLTIVGRSTALEQAIADLGLTDDFAPQGEAHG